MVMRLMGQMGRMGQMGQMGQMGLLRVERSQQVCAEQAMICGDEQQSCKYWADRLKENLFTF